MAFASNTTPATGSTLFGRIGAFLDNLRLAHEQHLEYRRTLEELRSLSDHELDDLGISRHDIPNIAAKSVR